MSESESMVPQNDVLDILISLEQEEVNILKDAQQDVQHLGKRLAEIKILQGRLRRLIKVPLLDPLSEKDEGSGE